MNRLLVAGVLLVGSIGHRTYGASTTVYEYKDVSVTGGIRSTDVTRTYTYDTNANQPLSETQTLYDDLGRQSQVTQVADASIVTAYEYDASGAVTLKTVGSLATAYVYDLRGRQITAKGPSSALDGNTDARVIYDYDKNSNVTTQRLRIGPGNACNKSITSYDSLNRATKTYAPVPADQATEPADFRLVSYDSQSRPCYEYSISGSTTLQQSRTIYDGAGRVVVRARMLNAASTSDFSVDVDDVTSYVYDLAGRVVREIKHDLGNAARPLVTTSAYDGFGRLILKTDPLGHTDQMVYDGAGLLRTRIRNDGAAYYSYMDYDERGRITQSISEANVKTVFVNDCLGRRITSKVYMGLDEESEEKWQITAYSLDMLGRQTLVTEDVGGLNRQTGYVYSAQGMLATQIAGVASNSLANGQTTAYDYSTEGAVSKITYPDGETLRYTYYPNGAVSQKTDQSNQTINYSYDVRGLLSTKADASDSNKYWITYSYDALGRMVTARSGTPSDPSSRSEVAYAYDDLGRQTSESQTIKDHTVRSVSTGHDQVGKRTHLSYPSTNPQ